MSKSIKKNYILNLVTQILTFMTPFLTAPYIARVLNADGIGFFSYAQSISSYFTLLAVLGINDYGRRQVAYYQDDIEKRSFYFWNIKALSFMTVTLCTAAYVIFILPRFNYHIIYILLIANIVSNFFDVNWFFASLEQFEKIVFRNIFIRIFDVAYIFLFVHSKDDLVIYAFGMVLVNFFMNVCLCGMLPKYIKKPDFSKIRPFTDFKVILTLFLPAISVTLFSSIDKTMLGVLSKSPFENGYYEQTMKLVNMALAVITSVSVVVSPRIGYLVEKKDFEQIKGYMLKTFQFIFLLAFPMMFGLIAIVPFFIPWFYGQGFDKVVILMQILSPLILFMGISKMIASQYLIQIKQENKVTLSIFIGGGINIILNYILIPRYLSVGAAIASSVSEFIVLVVTLYFVRKEFSPFLIVISSLKYLILSILMFVILHFISAALSPSIISTLILIAFGIGIYILFLMLVRDSFCIDFFRTIRRKIFERGME